MNLRCHSLGVRNNFGLGRFTIICRSCTILNCFENRHGLVMDVMDVMDVVDAKSMHCRSVATKCRADKTGDITEAATAGAV